MARRKRPKAVSRAGGSAPAPGASVRPPRRRLGRGGRIALAFAGVLVALVAGWRILGRGAAPRAPEEGVTDPRIMLDSQRVAIQRQDWDRSLTWAHRIAQTEPRNASVILALGLAVHNQAWGTSRTGALRWARRTSLDRLRQDLHGLALLDSAIALAVKPQDVALARLRRGQTLEILGLPVDALEEYYDLGQRMPDFTPVMPRGQWVTFLLNHPVPRAGAPPEPEPAALQP